MRRAIIIPMKLKKYPIFERLFNDPFDGEWLATFPEELQLQAINHLAKNATHNLSPFEPILQFLKKGEAEGRFVKNEVAMRHHLVLFLIFKGKLDEAWEIAVKNPNSPTSIAYLGWIRFFKGRK